MIGRKLTADLARVARETSRSSPEPGRKAWLVAAAALDQAATPAEALDILDGMVTSVALHILAGACLRSICPDGILASAESET